ncbi:MAG: biotin/lipoyl attachment domain-containing protein, partial [Planctomycetota bacterium]
MAKAYTPGLKVSARTTHRTRRLLPIPGEVKVAVGDVVEANDVVAETFMDGDITPMNMANRLSCSAGDVAGLMLKEIGEPVKAGEPIARSKGIFGAFKTEVTSDADGTLEQVSSVTGQVMIRGAAIPVQVRAYLSGTVIEVLPKEGCIIENDVMFVQGIFGIGGETEGVIQVACSGHGETLDADAITADMKGAVILGGARMTAAALRKAIEVGAAAVVSGGLDDQDLKQLLGRDLGVAITGSETIGITVIVTEGFGDIAMAARTWRLLAERAGRVASVNGATQIRAGVMRPEILVPLEAGENENEIDPTLAREAGLLELGTTVRV